MKQVDLMVFDLDGTLIDSAYDLTDSVNHALASLDLSPVSLDAVRSYVGDGVSMLMKRALGDHAESCFSPAMQLFRDYYEEHLLDKTALYPDVSALLAWFGSKKKVIATNKAEKYTLKIVKGLGIADAFLEVLGEDSAPFKKPDPRLLHRIMEKWGAVPERTVVIGDGPNDVLLAQNAGAISCAFLNGISSREKLLQLVPDMTCESLSELKALFA